MYRSLWTDDPVADAEAWVSREDKRPLRGYCEICKEPVYGENDGYDADDAYLFEDGIVCDRCLYDYLKTRRVK